MSAVFSFLGIDASFSYGDRPHGGDGPRSHSYSHRLVPTTVMVAVKNVTPKMRLVVLPDDVLPFGLLESVAIHGDGVPDFRVHVMKATGQRVSHRVSAASQRRVSVVSGAMNCDQDAADPTFAVLQDHTGHDLRFRMFFGDAVLSMALEFYDAPPTHFTLVYHGANALPRTYNVEDAKKRLAKKEKIEFLLTSKTPSQRLRLASSNAATGAPPDTTAK